MRKNILLTGLPHSGKSTLLNKIILDYKRRVGLVTKEIGEHGSRTGFEVETHSGHKAVIASINFKTAFKVSKYLVNLEDFEAMLPLIAEYSSEDLLFLDEIGQMQLLSGNFKELVIDYLDSPNICVATLSKVYDDDFTIAIKNRDDVIIVEIFDNDREAAGRYLKALIGKVIKAKRYAANASRFTVGENQAAIKTDHGTRSLERTSCGWMCACDFFKTNHICSHIIALEEHLKMRRLG